MNGLDIDALLALQLCLMLIFTIFAIPIMVTRKDPEDEFKVYIIFCITLLAVAFVSILTDLFCYYL